MSSKVIVFSTNSAWNILNFRISLINSLLSNGYKVICLCPYDEYFDKLQDAGFTCRAIPMSQYSKSTLSNLLTFFYYLFYFILYRPDLYLSFTAKPNILGGMAAKFLSISYIPNVAGLGQIFLHNNFFTKLIKYLYRLVLKDSKHVFFQNSDDQFLFVSEKIVRRDNHSILPGSGVDLSVFKFQSFNRDSNITFLMFSRLLISKGVYDYLNAAKQTLSMGYKCNFLLAGSILNNDGYVDPTIIDKFCDDDVIEYVNFTDDVLSLLKSCHCVVLPTYYPEGTPKSLLEAGACGKAIITTNTSGCRDVVIDGENGFLCNIKSPEDLSKAMVNYLELTIDKKLSFSKRSHEHVRHNYSDSMIIDSYLRIIDS